MPTRLLRKLLQSDRERFLESLLESATDYAIITLDLDGRITSWNSGAEHVLGWSEAEALGQNTSLFFTPEDQDAEAPAQEMANARDYGRATDERWHVRKGGERFWANGSLMPLVNDETNTIEGYLKILRDRTEQRLTEAKTRQSEAFLRGVLDSSGDCIKVLDLEGRIEFMNEGGLRGMEVEDVSAIQGRLWTSLWEDDGVAAAEKAMAAARAGGTGRFSGLAKTLKGTPRWWDVQVTPIAGPDGQPGKLLAISRDITDRRQAEAALRETVERYSLVTRATNDAIWDWDLVRNHARWNEALYTAYGYNPHEIEPSGEWRMTQIHPDDRQEVENHIRSVIAGAGDEWSHEYRFRCASGHYATVFDRGYMVRDAAGRPLRMIGAMLDITSRKRAEQELEVVHHELGHRLKNVLTMVQAIASHTLRSAPSMDVARETLAARLVALGKAQDLLITKSSEEAEIGTLVHSVLEAQRISEPERLRIRGPDARLSPQVALSLALILHELATNAVKYGALSNEQGHVDLVWTVTEDTPACLALRWSEHGGPTVTEPKHKGFGSRLITRGLAGGVGGDVTLRYEPTGVVCTITAPLDSLAISSPVQGTVA
ncbi:PAS domain S-box protein [Microvirga tunisiensis]|uniref:Blue-light-activated histidine kinase n=1 Tax=Microvirga tunisiensis TaxID=2108360 RepID=A0A5N7ML21_9HYPH|nr:PAS domain S-box protein [Microvirga tunisiensis]MPR08931.1 PAS domain S-box protein [Microvirga tunisiensis]MPR27139.1 PAS domain S-box protein [Microvirga tunisiensis]